MKQIKTILLNLPISEIEDPIRQPPTGLISIATFVANHGFEIEVVDLALEPKAKIPIADVYGFSTYTANYIHTVKLARALQRRNPDAILIAGGHHASSLPEIVLKDFNYVIIGEGETTLLSLLKQLQIDIGPRIPQIIENDPIVNADSFPYADLIKFSQLTRYSRKIEGLPAVCIDSSRGCNFQCRFCNSRVFKRGQWRARSAQNIYNEIRRYYDLGWRAVRFNDDNFLVDEMRILELCELIEPLGIKYRLFCRAESLNESLCFQLAKSGCRHIGIGIESLSPFMLAKMGKGESVQEIVAGIRSANNAGIVVRGYFICGFPGETDATVDESISYLSRIQLDEAVVYPCIPYPGTALYHDRDKFGITWIDPDFSKFIQIGKNRTAGFVMKTNTFGPNEVKKWRDRYMNAFSERGIAWAAQSGKVV